MILVFEPTVTAGPRATLVFHPRRAPPLTITVEGLHEAHWGFAHLPVLRVTWHFASPVRAVRFASVRIFDKPEANRALRVEVDIQGSPLLALEGDSLVVGPIPSVPLTPA